MFESLTGRLNAAFVRLRGKGRLSEADIDGALRDVRRALLEADVNVAVVREFGARVKERAASEEVSKSLTPSQQVIKIVHEELVSTLGSAPSEGFSDGEAVLVIGLQGSGKTTTAAKIANLLKTQGMNPLLVAADLERPAAVDQLEILGQSIDVPVFSDRAADAVKAVKGARKQAKRDALSPLVIDTAGRLQIDRELMRELSSVAKAAGPAQTFLVLDAMTGQDAINVASGFKAEIDLTGLILTKLDGDSRGGAAISAREVTGVPISYAGVGEGLGDLEVFHPDRMASRILGMGDVMTLIEKAEEAFEEDEAAAMVQKMKTAEFSLDDFLDQMHGLRRMGSVSQVVAMIPGAGPGLGDLQVDEGDLNRVEAIIRSMTPEERQDPKIIGGSRKRRIAAGSGTNPQAVNQLLRQHTETKKMMKMLADGRDIPGLPGIPGITPARRKKR